jgi:hypothetical protein
MKYRQSSMNETAAASGDDSPPWLSPADIGKLLRTAKGVWLCLNL